MPDQRRQGDPPVAVPERARITAGRSEARQRTHLVGVRLSPDEHADLTRLAASTGRSLPDVLRLGLTLLTATEAPHGA